MATPKAAGSQTQANRHGGRIRISRGGGGLRRGRGRRGREHQLEPAALLQGPHSLCRRRRYTHPTACKDWRGGSTAAKIHHGGCARIRFCGASAWTWCCCSVAAVLLYMLGAVAAQSRPIAAPECGVMTRQSAKSSLGLQSPERLLGEYITVCVWCWDAPRAHPTSRHSLGLPPRAVRRGVHCQSCPRERFAVL